MREAQRERDDAAADAEAARRDKEQVATKCRKIQDHNVYMKVNQYRKLY